MPYHHVELQVSASSHRSHRGNVDADLPTRVMDRSATNRTSHFNMFRRSNTPDDFRIGQLRTMDRARRAKSVAPEIYRPALSPESYYEEYNRRRYDSPSRDRSPTTRSRSTFRHQSPPQTARKRYVNFTDDYYQRYYDTGHLYNHERTSDFYGGMEMGWRPDARSTSFCYDNGSRAERPLLSERSSSSSHRSSSKSSRPRGDSKQVSSSSSSRKTEPSRISESSKDKILKSVLKTSSAQKQKNLFLAAMSSCLGVMTDEEFHVFDVEKGREDVFVRARTPWALRVAMYPSGSSCGSKCTTKYLVYRYDATKSFIAQFLSRVMDTPDVKLYTTTQTKNTLDQRYANVPEYEGVKRGMKNLEGRNMLDTCMFRPQRRSSVCLFRPNCVKRHECVYCLLEAMNNRTNTKSGLRAVKDTDIGKVDGGFLERLVNEAASSMPLKHVSKRSRSSSLSSCSSGSSSNSSSASSTASSSSSSSEKDNVKSRSIRRECKRRRRSVNKSPSPLRDSMKRCDHSPLRRGASKSPSPYHAMKPFHTGRERKSTNSPSSGPAAPRKRGEEEDICNDEGRRGITNKRTVEVLGVEAAGVVLKRNTVSTQEKTDLVDSAKRHAADSAVPPMRETAESRGVERKSRSPKPVTSCSLRQPNRQPAQKENTLKEVKRKEVWLEPCKTPPPAEVIVDVAGPVAVPDLEAVEPSTPQPPARTDLSSDSDDSSATSSSEDEDDEENRKSWRKN